MKNNKIMNFFSDLGRSLMMPIAALAACGIVLGLTAALKGIMSSFNIDFDKAFEVAKYDASLKDKYRKLINEE